MRARPIVMRRRANRFRMRIAVGVAAATALLWPQPAGAQADYTDLLWSLTSSTVHVVHCTQGTTPGWNANLTACRLVWPSGRSEFVAAVWVDPWCDLTVEAGDMVRPLVLRWRSSDVFGACAPGAGVIVWTDGYYAGATEGYVFPRSAAMPWARGTVVEVR